MSGHLAAPDGCPCDAIGLGPAPTSTSWHANRARASAQAPLRRAWSALSFLSAWERLSTQRTDRRMGRPTPDRPWLVSAAWLQGRRNVCDVERRIGRPRLLEQPIGEGELGAIR